MLSDMGIAVISNVVSNVTHLNERSTMRSVFGHRRVPFVKDGETLGTEGGDGIASAKKLALAS